jgi:hypothetical protein
VEALFLARTAMVKDFLIVVLLWLRNMQSLANVIMATIAMIPPFKAEW